MGTLRGIFEAHVESRMDRYTSKNSFARRDLLSGIPAGIAAAEPTTRAHAPPARGTVPSLGPEGNVRSKESRSASFTRR